MCPEEHVEYKCFLKEEERVFILFRFLRKDFLHSSGKFLAGLTKMGLTCPEHPFEDNWFMWNFHLFLTLLGFWAEKLWEFLDETIRQDCHNCSLCVRNNNSRKGFFGKIHLFSKLTSHLKLDLTLLSHLWIRFRQGCWSWDLHCQSNVWRSISFFNWKNFNFTFFIIGAQKIDPGETLSPSMSKLPLTRPESHFAENFFCENVEIQICFRIIV